MIVADPEKYFPSGVLGDSTSATASKGRKIDDYVVGRLCDMISKNFGIKRT
jgi:creatinine amidohydrolase/Fe(II)-dependent formamide hydrolase-like protein